MSTPPNYTASSELPIITFDYDVSPYGQKIRTLLAAAGIPYKACLQPRVLPRPDLEALGVTYRRIPVLSIGCDIFCDSSLICKVIQDRYPKLPTTPADKAYEAFGIMVFSQCLPVMPSKMITPDFVKDRETIFPILKSPNFSSLRPSALAELKSHMLTIENNFLSGGPFIGGSQLSMADIHVVWSVRWFLTNLGVGKEPGFSKDDFPKIYKWIESMPPIKPETLDAKSSQKIVKGSGHVDPAMHVDERDPLGIRAGTDVVVEGRDTKPGAHPQIGRLIGLYPDQVVLQLESGVRLHLPRAGYIVRSRSDSKI